MVDNNKSFSEKVFKIVNIVETEFNDFFKKLELADNTSENDFETVKHTYGWAHGKFDFIIKRDSKRGYEDNDGYNKGNTYSIEITNLQIGESST